ncbi:MAG TPA: hypothetical protein VGN95_00490 [Pyrinomonadaceae bacterium]|jgi:hypothetical protein|nr:hypothetical protein [Pyrinomonadaceae bacterium]
MSTKVFSFVHQWTCKISSYVARRMSRIKQCSVGTVSHGQVNVAHNRIAVAAFVG